MTIVIDEGNLINATAEDRGTDATRKDARMEQGTSERKAENDWWLIDTNKRRSKEKKG